MAKAEDTLPQAERHVREGEARLVKQAALVERLAARRLDPSRARDTLERLRATLRLWREDLARLRLAHGSTSPDEPSSGQGAPRRARSRDA